MGKIKISEIFYSLQGEGKYLGVPSLFLRTFGCNFTCSGYGMPRGELSKERHTVNAKEYDKYESLPLVHTGCDSYAAWDPRFKHLSPIMTIEQIVDRMQELLPNGKFSSVHLIITGGEPLLGWQKQYIELFEEIERREMLLCHVTFETNGTKPLIDALGKYLSGNALFETTFSISSKLPGSGHDFNEAIIPEVIWGYQRAASHCYFKWVVSNQEEWEDVQTAKKLYEEGNVYVDDIYLMPAGGTTKLYDGNEQWVAELCMKHGYRFSPRLQVQLWKNAWGT